MALAIIVTLNLAIVDVSAAESDTSDSAEKLSKVGIFKGSNKGFELEREPSRLEGLVMFIRLIGKEDGDVATVKAPAGIREYEIVDIKYI